MARPIITTNAVGCREVVDDGVNGLLVPIKDVGALAEACRKLIGEPEMRRSMGAAGRRKVVREFDEQIVIRRCQTIYRSDRLHISERIAEVASKT